MESNNPSLAISEARLPKFVVLLTKILGEDGEVLLVITQWKKKGRLRYFFQEYNDCPLFETWRYNKQ